MDAITILVPSYKRRRFLPLLIRNIKLQEYPHQLLSVIIDDDSPEDEKLIISNQELKDIQEHLHPIKLQYKYSKNKRSIGKKRNELVKSAETKIITFMDDDDVYMPTYITYQYQLLKENKAGCVGSNKMIFTMSEKDWKVYAIDCGDVKSLIHEATLMMTKKWYRASCGFENSSQGEGKNIFVGMERTVVISDVVRCMICIQHPWNTIDKLQFCKDECRINIEINEDLKNILEKILKTNSTSNSR